MSRIVTELTDELFDEYMVLEDEETSEMEIKPLKPVKERLSELLGKFNATNILLRKTEYNKMFIELEYEQKLIELKREALSEGLKSTEAKEWAKLKTVEQQKQLIQLENDINLLKDNKKNIEKQLKYKFLELQKEWFDISDTLQIVDDTEFRVKQLETEIRRLQDIVY